VVALNAVEFLNVRRAEARSAEDYLTRDDDKEASLSLPD